MRILIIVPDFPLDAELIKGGVSSALANLLKGFANYDISVRVITFNREISEVHVAELSKKIHVYYIPESKLPHVFNFAFKGGKSIRNHIRQFRPSIVHYGMSGYILLTKIFGLLNVIHIVTIHGIPFLEAKQKKSLKEKLVYYTNGFVEKLLFPSNIVHLSNYSKKQYVNKNNHVAVIPNAIDPAFLLLPSKNTTSNKLLYIGSIEPRKNILFILQVLKVLHEQQLFFSLDVLGGFTDSVYKEEVLTFIKCNQLAKMVTFHGWASQQQLQVIMGKADILFVSSRQETMPMVVEEAMSAGKVVVCSAVGGIPEMIIDKQDGFLFNSFSIDAVLPVMKTLYNNNELVKIIGTNARKKAMSAYHCNNVAQKTISFYQSLSPMICS